MAKMRNAVVASLISAWALFAAPEAQAATVNLNFDEPIASPLVSKAGRPGIIEDRCAEGSCLGVNVRGAARLLIDEGRTFSVQSFWFRLLGGKTNLLIETSNGTLQLLVSEFHHSGSQVIDVSGNTLFQNITSLSFLTNRGNARIDNMVLDVPAPAPVPLPAPAFLLMAGLASLGVVRRRKKLG